MTKPSFNYSPNFERSNRDYEESKSQVYVMAGQSGENWLSPIHQTAFSCTVPCKFLKDVPTLIFLFWSGFLETSIPGFYRSLGFWTRSA